MTFRFDPEEYCRQATERRKRLMNPPTSNKPSPAPTAQRTVNIAHGIPAWRRGCGITFDAHVSDYLKSSRFAQGPNVYIRRRAAEMGFAAGDVLDFIRF